MITQQAPQTFMAAANQANERVQGKLHAYIKETVSGLPTVSLVWNEAPDQTHKDVVFQGEAGFDALMAVKALNRSNGATQSVVSVLVGLYVSQNNLAGVLGYEF